MFATLGLHGTLYQSFLYRPFFKFFIFIPIKIFLLCSALYDIYFNSDFSIPVTFRIPFRKSILKFLLGTSVPEINAAKTLWNVSGVFLTGFFMQYHCTFTKGYLIAVGTSVYLCQ